MNVLRCRPSVLQRKIWTLHLGPKLSSKYRSIECPVVQALGPAAQDLHISPLDRRGHLQPPTQTPQPSTLNSGVGFRIQKVPRFASTAGQKGVVGQFSDSCPLPHPQENTPEIEPLCRQHTARHARKITTPAFDVLTGRSLESQSHVRRILGR